MEQRGTVRQKGQNDACAENRKVSLMFRVPFTKKRFLFQIEQRLFYTHQIFGSSADMHKAILNKMAIDKNLNNSKAPIPNKPAVFTNSEKFFCFDSVAAGLLL